MFRNRSVDVHQFAMIPKADVPRSTFNRQSTHKTTFDAGLLIPVFLDEVLPGDTFHLKMTAFARVSTPIFPIMDNLYLDSFFFFVPNRLVWSNWKKFMGEQANPADSISFVIPQMTSAVGGFVVGSIFDYFGLPTVGQVGGGNSIQVSCLPLRCYNLIYNEWFRDENLQNSVPQNVSDGPDNIADYTLLRRGKRKDYFTSCLPWPQKGGTAVSIPLGTKAPVLGLTTSTGVTQAIGSTQYVGTPQTGVSQSMSSAGTMFATSLSAVGTAAATAFNSTNSNVFADLSSATAATINQLRQAFQIQKLLERDARGGTRYTEIVRAHFGVISPDARLQRPEYLGGGSQAINISPIAQTSGTGITGGTTPMGTLSAMGTVVAAGHGFTQSFTEHGHIIGLVSVRADLTYQQGIRKLWDRSTRYDFYFPAFAMLGEQAVLNKEIYADGSANDDLVFGYQERWAEYRYFPSQISGLFKSTSAGTIDGWHLAQKFLALPTLNTTFIQETPPMSRIVAVGAAANGQQFIFDSFFDIKTVRPLPMFSVPGLIDHF
ncbi:MAG: major capsid protein [Microviridae sp.]|nr:MAG: major capsid protein [Microviridae sp.]